MSPSITVDTMPHASMLVLETKLWPTFLMLTNWRFKRHARKLAEGRDRYEIAWACAQLKEGDLAIDVGAHRGAYTWWFRQNVGPTGRVVAFEPQAKLAASIGTTLSKLGCDNVEIVPSGVSVKSGVHTLRVPHNTKGYSSGATFEEKAIGGRVDERSTEVVSLDEFFAGSSHRVALLKVDVEGHELEALRGAEQLLRKFHPAILLEAEARHRSEGAVQTVFDYLLGLGYRGEYFCGRDMCPLSDFDPARDQNSEGARFWESPSYCNNFAFVYSE
jgi:FkbM family methyltransferase